jgi:hypothetical protein
MVMAHVMSMEVIVSSAVVMMIEKRSRGKGVRKRGSTIT